MPVIKSVAPNSLWYPASHWGRELCADTAAMQEKILADLISSNWSLEDFFNHQIILSFMGEGHCMGDLDKVIDAFDSSHGRDRYVILVSAKHAELPTQPPVYYFPQSLIGQGGMIDNLQKHLPGPDTPLTQKFLCLIRRASPARAAFASSLRQSPFRDFVKMSFGSLNEPGYAKAYGNLFPNDQLPILLDGAISGEQSNLVFDVADSWYGCLFNIVVETSNQTDPGVFRSVFITEKTFKAFAMCQIPIWFAVPGTVNQVRQLGFDLFDDLIDHSYDNIEDQTTRCKQIYQQLLNLHETLSLPQCQTLRYDVWERLQNNLSRLHQTQVEMNQYMTNFITVFASHGPKYLNHSWQ